MQHGTVHALAIQDSILAAEYRPIRNSELRSVFVTDRGSILLSELGSLVITFCATHDDSNKSSFRCAYLWCPFCPALNINADNIVTHNKPAFDTSDHWKSVFSAFHGHPIAAAHDTDAGHKCASDARADTDTYPTDRPSV
jgi:hypothetical protein